jgi:carbonic anhydrase
LSGYNVAVYGITLQDNKIYLYILRKKLYRLQLCLCNHGGLIMVQPQEALNRLKEGNRRFFEDKLLHPNRSHESREAVSERQKPFAIILGCSDSRVPAEILFDQGVGDLFVVRVAGNVLGPLELDSIEYSSLYLGSSLIVVLGHERCGAVQAVIDGNITEIESVAQLIEPSVAEARKQTGNLVENAIKINVNKVANQIKDSLVIRKLLQEEKIFVVGGYYDLASGKIEWLN